MIFALLVAGCASPDPVEITTDSSANGSSDTSQSTFVSIAALKSRYLGSSHPIIDDLYLEGRVSANDLYGEYYRAFIIEDSTAAIEVRIDSYDVYALFPVGSNVRVVCSDLWLSSSGGATIIGAEPDADDYLVGYISDALLERSVMLADDSIETPIVSEVDLSQLDRTMISRRVLVRDLEFVESEHTTFASRDAETGRFVDTSHILRDTLGREVELVIASTVSYAEATLPQGLFNLEAIVEYSSIDGLYALRLVDFAIY